MKTPLIQIDRMVVDELADHDTTAHVLVPLPQDIYNQLWAVIRPEDRYSQAPELYEMLPSHLCAGKESPVYVAEGYTPTAGGPEIRRLSVDVVSPKTQERILEQLVPYLLGHPWSVTAKAQRGFWTRLLQKVGL